MWKGASYFQLRSAGTQPANLPSPSAFFRRDGGEDHLQAESTHLGPNLTLLLNCCQDRCRWLLLGKLWVPQPAFIEYKGGRQPSKKCHKAAFQIPLCPSGGIVSLQMRMILEFCTLRWVIQVSTAQESLKSMCWMRDRDEMVLFSLPSLLGHPKQFRLHVFKTTNLKLSKNLLNQITYFRLVSRLRLKWICLKKIVCAFDVGD